MAVPNIYSSMSTGGTPGGIEATEAQIGLGTQRATTDWAESQRRLTSSFTQRSLPKLQSSIASAGQYYSSARKKDEGFATEDFYNAGYDINSALQRQLGDFEQQRMFAALGAIL